MNSSNIVTTITNMGISMVYILEWELTNNFGKVLHEGKECVRNVEAKGVKFEECTKWRIV